MAGFFDGAQKFGVISCFDVIFGDSPVNIVPNLN